MLRTIPVLLVVAAFLVGGCVPTAQPSGTLTVADDEQTAQPTDERTADPTDTPEPIEEEPSEAVAEGCLAIEEPEELEPIHIPVGEAFSDYSSDPPSSGSHWAETEEEGSIYAAGDVAIERLVHNLEHGAVILWTNDLSEDEIELAEAAVNEIYGQGYGALIMVHDYPMDATFAMTAWGFYQECGAIDEGAIQAFVDSYYGSGPANGEGAIACAAYEGARDLPGCEKWADQLPGD